MIVWQETLLQALHGNPINMYLCCSGLNRRETIH